MSWCFNKTQKEHEINICSDTLRRRCLPALENLLHEMTRNFSERSSQAEGWKTMLIKKYDSKTNGKIFNAE